MNTRPIPPFLALSAGAIVCIMAFMQRMEIVAFAKKFVLVCLIFLFIGFVIRLILDKFMKTGTLDSAKDGEKAPEDLDSDQKG